MLKKKIIYYLDAICGQGKTHSIVDHIAIKSQSNPNYKAFIAVSTDVTADAVFDIAKKLNVKASVCTYESLNFNHSPVKSPRKAIKSLVESNEYQVIIATDLTYYALGQAFFDQNFNEIFFDDIRSISGQVNLCWPDNLQTIDHYFEPDLTATLPEGYMGLNLKVKEKTYTGDTITDQVLPLIERYRSHSFSCLKARWDDLHSGKIDTSVDSKQKNTLQVFYTPNKDLFDLSRVTFARHDFKNSEPGKILKSYGYEFKQSPLTSKLKRIEKNSYLNVEIEYFTLGDRPCSLDFLIKEDFKNFKTLAGHISQNYKRAIGICSSSINYEFRQLAGAVYWIRTLNAGSNEYTDYNQVLCLIPFLYSNITNAYYKDFYGLNSDEILEFTRLQNDYQTIMRSILRKYQSVNKKTKVRIMVLDAISAAYIKRQLGQIMHEENITVNPAKVATSNNYKSKFASEEERIAHQKRLKQERNRRYYKNKQEKQAIDFINEMEIEPVIDDIDQDMSENVSKDSHMDVIDIKEENNDNPSGALESIEKNDHIKPLPKENNGSNRILKGQNFRDEKLIDKVPPDFDLDDFMQGLKDDEGDSHSIPEKYKHLSHNGISGNIESPYDPFAVPDVGIGKVMDLPPPEYNPNDKKLSLAELLEHEVYP